MPTEHDLDFAKSAVDLRFAAREQVDSAIENLRKMEEMGMETSLGEVMIRKGFISRDQCRAVLVNIGFRGKQPIPGYEIVQKLGQGGMGAVYKAKQLSTDRIVALKIIPPKLAKNPEVNLRFTREARAVAKLNHPNIVSAIETGEADGYLYLSMEFVAGKSLGEILEREGLLPPERALDYMKQAAKGLSHAHRRQLIHRDVKPDNLLLTEEGVVKVADLGVAKFLDDTARLTAAGTTFGTPKYISPEQAKGLQNIDARSDIYSLGASFFHLVTGVEPYRADNPLTIMNMHINAPLPDPCDYNPSVPKSIALLIMKMMAKSPADRFPDAEALIRAMDLAAVGKFVEEVPVVTAQAVIPKQVKPPALDKKEAPQPEPTIPEPKFLDFKMEQEVATKKVEEKTVVPEKSRTGAPARTVAPQRTVSSPSSRSKPAEESSKKKTAEISQDEELSSSSRWWLPVVTHSLAFLAGAGLFWLVLSPAKQNDIPAVAPAIMVAPPPSATSTPTVAAPTATPKATPTVVPSPVVISANEQRAAALLRSAKNYADQNPRDVNGIKLRYRQVIQLSINGPSAREAKQDWQKRFNQQWTD